MFRLRFFNSLLGPAIEASDGLHKITTYRSHAQQVQAVGIGRPAPINPYLQEVAARIERDFDGFWARRQTEGIFKGIYISGS
jgi:hypothetical protein